MSFSFHRLFIQVLFLHPPKNMHIYNSTTNSHWCGCSFSRKTGFLRSREKKTECGLNEDKNSHQSVIRFAHDHLLTKLVDVSRWNETQSMFQIAAIFFPSWWQYNKNDLVRINSHYINKTWNQKGTKYTATYNSTIVKHRRNQKLEHCECASSSPRQQQYIVA